MRLQIQIDIKRNSRGYIVIRSDGEYEQHSHVTTLNGCRMLISFIRQRRLPRSKYLQESARRLLTDDEYGQLRQKKQKYVNVNKGVR